MSRPRLQVLLCALLLMSVIGCRNPTDKPVQTPTPASPQEQAKTMASAARIVEVVPPASFSAEQLPQNGPEEFSIHATAGQYLLLRVNDVRLAREAEYSIVIQPPDNTSGTLKPVREGGRCASIWLYALSETGNYHVVFDPVGVKHGLEFDLLANKNPILDAGITSEQVSIDLDGFAQNSRLAAVAYAQGDACDEDDLGAPAHLALENDQIEFRIMPIDGLKLLWGTDQSILHLEAAIRDSDTKVDARVLPYAESKGGDAANVMTSRQEALHGEGWHGVRWIGGYAQDGEYPSGLGYVFEGISDDHRFFILVRAPISNSQLQENSPAAAHKNPQSKSVQVEMRDRLSKALALAPPASFQPDLHQLDSVIESLKLQH